MDKDQLRTKLQKCLFSMSDEQRIEKSRQVCQRLISMVEFQVASTVMLFLSLPHEVDTTEAILAAWQSGKTVAVPKVSWQQRHMIPVQIHSLENGFSTEAPGLQNPVNGVPIPFEEIDMVVTPGLGFDREGNRLGRGGSYYDRFFAHEKLAAHKCGICFSEQVVDSVPTIEHDKCVDSLVTDREVIYFNAD